jgi:hypothetical protein
MGFAWVPADGRRFLNGSYHVVPLKDREGRTFCAILMVIPADSLRAAVQADPGGDGPVGALLRIEVERLRVVHERTGMPMPPALAKFFYYEDRDEDAGG